LADGKNPRADELKNPFPPGSGADFFALLIVQAFS
jgi:hypothetical protein